MGSSACCRGYHIGRDKLVPRGSLVRMTKSFRPLGDRVLVKRVQAEEKSPGGIIIPDNAKEKARGAVSASSATTAGVNGAERGRPERVLNPFARRAAPRSSRSKRARTLGVSASESAWRRATTFHEEHMAAPSNGHATEPDHLPEVLLEVVALLAERGVPQEDRDRMLAAIRASDEVAARRCTIDFWRGVARRHGVAPAAEACGISRFRFLCALADIVELGALYAVLSANMGRGTQLDEDAARRATRGEAP
jgi:hypothetical protein